MRGFWVRFGFGWELQDSRNDFGHKLWASVGFALGYRVPITQSNDVLEAQKEQAATEFFDNPDAPWNRGMQGVRYTVDDKSAWPEVIEEK